VFSVVTLGLFWFVLRYNLLYVSVFSYDTGGRLYPTALKQLFTGVYMMELCLIGLFLFIRDEQGVFTGIGQAVIMMIATVLTVIYQLLLGNAFASILEYLPAYMENRNDSEGKLKQECSSAGALSPLCQLLHSCYGWMVPSKKVPRDLQEGIYKLARNQLNLPSQCGYEHEIVQCSSPVVWIPKDGLGISDDEITHARDFCQDIRISNELADLDMKGKLEISRSICNMDVIQ